MKVQIVSLFTMTVLMFTSLTVFAGPTAAGAAKMAAPVALGADFSGSRSTSMMDVCTVELADAASNLNVRTWEGRVIGKLRHGTPVFVSDYSGEWAKVSVKRGRRWVSMGWVDSNYLLC
jgi:hypothetical protein